MLLSTYGVSVNTVKTPRVACSHKKVDQILTENHEICCKNCGVILDIDNAPEVSASQSTVNLFQQIHPGTRPVKLTSTGLLAGKDSVMETHLLNLHDPKTISSQFSNACDKLNLPSSVALHAWKIYSRLEKTNHKRKLEQQNQINELFSNTNSSSSKTIETCKILTNKKMAMFAIFDGVRKFAVLCTETQIIKAVDIAYASKPSKKISEVETIRLEKKKERKMPTMMKVIADVKPLAQEIGINVDGTKGQHLKYWIQIYLQQNQKKVTECYKAYPSNIIAIAIDQAIRSNQITDEAKARISVKSILLSLGVA